MVLVALILSCAPRQDSLIAGSAPAAAVEPIAAAAGPSAKDPSVVRLHMGERFRELTLARDSLVQGRHEEARAALLRLSMLDEEPGLPEGWGGWLRGMSEHANRGSQSTDIASLAAAVAQTANQCGGCHESLGRKAVLPHPGPAPTSVSGLTPTGDPGVARHMEGHQWAVDRMWAGLVQPSDAAWSESLQVLTVPALDMLTDEVGARESAAVVGATLTLHELARAGMDDNNPDTRADLYGQVLGTCAGCHALRKSGG